MSHPNTHRAAATLDPSNSSDPTTGNRLKSAASTITTTNPATVSNHFSKLQLSGRASRAQKPHVDTHQQAKALARSAILDSSKNGPFPVQELKTARITREKDKKALTVAAKGGEKEKSNDEKKVIVVAKEKVTRKPKGANEDKVVDDDAIKPQVELKLIDGGGGGGGRRRRSFGDVQVELADFFFTNGVKVVSVDMPPFMQIHAVNCARKARDSLEKFTSRTLASCIKKEFDGVYGPAWHCIVGTSFGSFVTHSVGGFIYFSMDQKLYILLFKTAVQRLE